MNSIQWSYWLPLAAPPLSALAAAISAAFAWGAAKRAKRTDRERLEREPVLLATKVKETSAQALDLGKRANVQVQDLSMHAGGGGRQKMVKDEIEQKADIVRSIQSEVIEFLGKRDVLKSNSNRELAEAVTDLHSKLIRVDGLRARLDRELASYESQNLLFMQKAINRR